MMTNHTVKSVKKTFYSKGNLKLHVKSKHKKEFIHKCEVCGYGTNNKQTLTSHRIKEHASKEEADKIEKFTCNICQKQFVTKQLLQKHLCHDLEKFQGTKFYFH